MTDELALHALALNFSLCGININTPGLYFTSMYNLLGYIHLFKYFQCISFCFKYTSLNSLHAMIMITLYSAYPKPMKIFSNASSKRFIFLTLNFRSTI